MSNYAKINDMDVVNGEGIRVSIFFTGCTHHCKNCFNSELWDFNCGIPFTEDTINTVIELMKPDYIRGLSILGGEPFQNLGAVFLLVKAAKKIYPNKDIWIWTGYDFNELNFLKSASDMEGRICYEEILNNVDVIIDGRYEDDKKDLTLKWMGSSNQNIWRKIDNKWEKYE